MIVQKFTLRIVAVIISLVVVSCLQQSNRTEAIAVAMTPTAAAFTAQVSPSISQADDDIKENEKDDDDDDDKVEQVQQRKLLANFSLGSFLPPVSKITLPKLPAIPKRNTITLTTTVLTQKTEHVRVYPTCIKLHNIQSLCNGYLETILPTPILPSTVAFWKSSDSDYDDQDQDMADRKSISPSATQSIQPTRIIVEQDAASHKNIVEPSEYEYEFTSGSSSQYATPESTESDAGKAGTGSFLDTILGPKYKIVKEQLTITKVIQYTDYAHTATLLAVNCLPPGLQYPLCDLQHIHPLVQRLKMTVDKPDKPKDNDANSVDQKVNQVYQHVNDFVMNNPYGLLGISPEQTSNQFHEGGSDLMNLDDVSSISRTAALQFPVGRLIDNTY